MRLMICYGRAQTNKQTLAKSEVEDKFALSTICGAFVYLSAKAGKYAKRGSDKVENPLNHER